jgi:hypothetical protein
MSLSDRLVRWSGARLWRGMTLYLPLIVAAVALATVASAVRRKGLLGGVMDTGLNAVPFVGAAKNVIEVARGRDFVPDR